MDKNSFLPLGSIVLLKDAKRYIVIIGYAVIEEGSSKVWDYMGCAYPIGVVNSTNNLLFNKEQIDKVIFTGFSDEEGDKFISILEDSISKVRNNGR